MHPKVNDRFQKLAEKYELQGAFLEIGVTDRDSAILSGDYFAGRPERFATNLTEKEILEADETAIHLVRCNSNNMAGVFDDGHFNTILSNNVIENDKYFWRSLDEMKRILAPGGILVIGAPAYVPSNTLKRDIENMPLHKTTVTMDVQPGPDYWRFSRLAFGEVLCEGLEILEITVTGRVPMMIAVARKPLDGQPAAPWQDLEDFDPEMPVKPKGGGGNGKKAKQKTPKQLLREAKLQARAEKMQARAAAEGLTENPAEGSSPPLKGQAAKAARLQERAAKKQAREAKQNARNAKAEALPGEREGAAPPKGKLKRTGKRPDSGDGDHETEG